MNERRRRRILLVVSAVSVGIGATSKYYRGAGVDVVVGQFEDFFGTVFLILVARAVFLHAAMWRVTAPIVSIVVAIEFSQLVQGGVIEQLRATWLGAHILGSTFEVADLVAYFLAAAAAVAIDRRARA